MDFFKAHKGELWMLAFIVLFIFLLIELHGVDVSFR